MLWELSVVEQRYRAVLEVLAGGRPGGHMEVRTPPRTLASCRGMESMAACGDASRTTWSAAADIASWACGGMTWSCSQMMYVAGCVGWGAVLGAVMLDTDVST